MFSQTTLRIGVALALGLQVAAVGAVECDGLADRAKEIRAERDRDAGRGVEMGRSLLAEIDASDTGCPVGEVLLHAALASNLHVAGRVDEALAAVGKALADIDRIENPVDLATVHRTAGVIYWELDAHDQALSHYRQALKFSRVAGDQNGVARTAGNIGNLHNSLGNWEESERYHREALSAFETVELEQGVAGTLVNLGALADRRAASFEGAGRLDEARVQHRANLEFNRRALTLFESLGNPRGIAYAADNIARALVNLDRPAEALDFHERSIALRREVQDSLGTIQSLLTAAEIQVALDQDEAALVSLTEALAAVPEGNTGLRRQVIERRIQVLAGSQQWQDAFEAQERLIELQEASTADEISTRVREMEMRYQAEQLERELALERTRAELSEQQAQRQRVISLGSIATALMLLMIVILVYNRYRLGKRVSHSLDRAARSDSLTGLPNRRDMSEHIEQALTRLDDSGEVAALVMADIDNFKRINDSLGHQAGDQILVHVADLLEQHVRGRDRAARWGGEEFLLLLPATDKDGAVSVCENLRRALAESPPELYGQMPHLTMTFGVVELEPGMGFNDALKAADDAMYAGKSRGKDRIVSGSGRADA